MKTNVDIYTQFDIMGVEVYNGGNMNKFKVTVYTTGLKKRDRKVKRHYFNAGYIDYKPIMAEGDIDELNAKAMGLVETNMKSFTGIEISLDKVEINGDIETWMPFSDENIRLKVV